MSSLNQIMCGHTTLCIVVPSVSRQAHVVTDGLCRGGQFTFDFVSSEFQIMPVRFQPCAMDANEMQQRNASVALFQNRTLLSELNDMNFNVGVEQDAIILDNGSLHDPRRGRDTSHSPDRTNPPTRAAPASRRFVGYFHTHPFSQSMRPPTPSDDWNEVPGVGFPGAGSALHFMIEGNKRVWGLLQRRRAFIVGIIQSSGLEGVDPGSRGYGFCWGLS